MEPLESQIARWALSFGIPRFGVCAYDPALAALPCRARMRLPNGARSILVFLFPYYVGTFPYRNLSRYAMVDDYHTVALDALRGLCVRLEAACTGDVFVPFVDDSPIREVEAAVRAGLGVRGLNGLLLSADYGSYVFLGEIVTTRAFSPAAAGPRECCRCGACLRRCPGGALGSKPGEPFGLDKERCLSHLTQKKMLLPAQEPLVGAAPLLWGCDVCSDVCPQNRHVLYSPIGAFYRNIRATLTPDNLDGALVSSAFSWRPRAVVQRNLILHTPHPPGAREIV